MIHFVNGSRSSTSTCARVHLGNYSTTHTFAILDHMLTQVTFGIDFWETHRVASESRLNHITFAITDAMTEADHGYTSTTSMDNQAHHDPPPTTSTTRTPDENTITTDSPIITGNTSHTTQLGVYKLPHYEQKHNQHDTPPNTP
jgi:hypothetical protein